MPESCWIIQQTIFESLEEEILKVEDKDSDIYRTVVFPTLTNGGETWNWNAKQMRKMEGIQYRLLLTVCGKTWQDKVS